MRFFQANYFNYLLLVLFVSLSTCENLHEELIYYDSANFTVTEMQIGDSTLFIKVLVKNEGNYSFKAPWNIAYDIIPIGSETGLVFSGLYQITTPLECEQILECDTTYNLDYFSQQAISSFQINNFTAWYIIE